MIDHDPFGLGTVPLAGESSKEKNVCAFCENEMNVNPRFFKIDEDKRVGDVPLVLTDIKHPEAQFVCMEHWRQNKELFEVCARSYLQVNKLISMVICVCCDDLETIRT